MATLFTIPGNIKQQYLPFVLNPASALNKNADKSRDFKGKKTGAQWFSFRSRSDEGDFPSGYGKLQICPSTLTSIEFGKYFDQDISNMLLYGRDAEGMCSKQSVTLQDIFNQIPGVQIREFLPDTRLDQCLNFMSDMLSSIWDIAKSALGGVGDMFKSMLGIGSANAGNDEKKNAAETAKAEADWKTKFEKITAAMWHAFDYLTGSSTPDNLFQKNGQSRWNDGSLSGPGIYSGGSYDVRVLTLPYLLYYRLQTCLTTNVYEIPLMGYKNVFNTQGSNGWEGGKGIGSGAADGFLNKIPMFGDMIKKVLGNIQIHYMPAWEADKGTGTQHPQVDIKFDLFNDTLDAALMNFIFVNTIFPNNMWIQFGIFEHSSSLYDVKIEGLDRLFACSGDFSVEYDGVLRNPPRSFVERLVYKHGNGDVKTNGGQINRDNLVQAIMQENLIKIPDVYHITLAFKSLLPQNFNNYLFTYSNNSKMENRYKNGELLNLSFTEEYSVSQMVKDFGKDIKEYMAKLDTKEGWDEYKAAEEAKKNAEEAKKKQL